MGLKVQGELRFFRTSNRGVLSETRQSPKIIGVVGGAPFLARGRFGGSGTIAVVARR